MGREFSDPGSHIEPLRKYRGRGRERGREQREVHGEARGVRSSFRSVMEERAHIGSMDGRVTTGRPAGTLCHELRMVHRTDDQLPGGGTLDLRVAFQAKVAVAFDQHLGVDRSVRLMAGHASLP